MRKSGSLPPDVTPGGDLFTLIRDLRVERVYVRHDPVTGLDAVIALHDTRRGPALGGVRFRSYTNGNAAIADALRLARAMSYKAALAGIPYGGGKAVMLRPETLPDRAQLFTAMGRFIEELGGRYVAAMDSGTTVDDMEAIARTTDHVTCTRAGGGDPAPYTAFGVRCGIEAAVAERFDGKGIEGLRVVIQGVGHVGHHLARELSQRGVRLWVADVDHDAAERVRNTYGAQIVAPEEIFDIECDVFAPCALGGVIDKAAAVRLKCKVVAGAANNPLTGPEVDAALAARGILYAPDFVINAGGLIAAALGVEGRLMSKIAAIRDTLTAVFHAAHEQRTPPGRAAERMAEETLYGAPIEDPGAHSGAGVA